MSPLDPDLRALQEVRDHVRRAKAALDAVASATQADVDGWCRAMAEAGERAAYDLARLAVEETGIGRVHYKILKNLLGSKGTWEAIRDERTVGILTRDEKRGILEVGTPAGVIAGIVPTTNPTSTALNKAIISVKGRNSIVISPHPRAKRCIGETVEVLRAALERAGAPPDLVQSLSNPTLDSTGALMKHRDVSLILATGGPGLVRAAYSAGKPAYGVGPGNVPVYVDRSADIERAAQGIVASQSFDNATLCCSEQALVVDRPIAERLLEQMKKRGAYVCNAEETAKLERYCNVGGHMNADVVGLDPWKIASAAGFEVPRATSVLLAHQGGVGPEFPLSIEILCPLLSVHVVDGWEEGCRESLATLHQDGLGHTIGVWARDEAVLNAWFLEKPANRIVVNGPTSMGAVGYSTWLTPAMSLGCGPQAGNITSDNITAKHLINVKRVAYLRSDWDALERADHERAAALGGERAPRGSGLPGDPALELAGGPGSATTADGHAASNWRGNPAFVHAAPQNGAAPAGTEPRQAKVRAAVKAAPRFSDAAVAPTPRAVPSGAFQAASPRPAAQPNVGAGLSPAEIQGILAHAGSGCPLGPCQGCQHHDTNTGACNA